MQNLRDFFRHLAKPPEIKPKIRSIRMFFHQVKNARQRSATTSIQKSFRTFAVWIRHSKNKPVDESKPTTLKLMRHMLRKSKPPADKSFKSKNIFLYAFQRKKAAPLEKPKSHSIILRSLKETPKINPRSIWKTIQDAWFHLSFLLRPRAKKPTASDMHEVTKGQLVMLSIRQDSLIFQSRFQTMRTTFAEKILPHWKRAVFAVLVLPVILEIFLQFTSLLAWPLIQTKKGLPGPNEHVILCVGDSFTSGRFSAFQLPSYVPFLHDFLSTESKTDWKVVNFSSEFMTADDVLRKTPELLQKQRPDLIYIMVGINDLASHGLRKTIPDRIQQNPSGEIERPEFHSEILFQKLRQNFSPFTIFDVIAVPPWFLLEKPPLAGYRPEYISFSESKLNSAKSFQTTSVFPVFSTWYSKKGDQIQFQGNRKVLMEGSPAAYTVLGNLLTIEKPGQAPQNFLWHLNEEGLILTGQGILDIHLYQKGKPGKTSVGGLKEKQEAAWRELSMDSPESARVLFEDALKLDPDDPATRAGLAQTYFELGIHSRTRNHMYRLLGQFRKNSNYENTRALLSIYLLEAAPNDVSRVTYQSLRRYPRDPWIWQTVAQCSYLSSRLDLARLAIDRALEVTPSEFSLMKSNLLRIRADIFATIDPEASLANVFQAYALDQNEERLIAALRKNGLYYFSLSPQKALNRTSCTSEQRKYLIPLFSYALDEQLLIQKQYFDHRLRSIVWQCQQYHAQPVLVNYVVPNPDIRQVTRTVAEETGAAWLNLNPRFEALIKADVKHEYIHEGRYNDSAGRKIAEWIAEDARMRLPAK